MSYNTSPCGAQAWLASHDTIRKNFGWLAVRRLRALCAEMNIASIGVGCENFLTQCKSGKNFCRRLWHDKREIFASTWNSHEATGIFHKAREKKCCDDFVSRDCRYRTGIFRRCSCTSSAGQRCARNRLRESERTSARGGERMVGKRNSWRNAGGCGGRKDRLRGGIRIRGP